MTKAKLKVAANVPNATTRAAMKEARNMSANKTAPELFADLAAQPQAKSLLHRAHDTIHGERQQDYGDKLTNFAQTAMIWNGILAHKLQDTATITPEDVALLMMGLKMARLAKNPDHFDSILDIAGYAGCMSILQDEREQGVVLPGAVFDPRQ